MIENFIKKDSSKKILSLAFRIIDWFIHPSIKEIGPDAFRQARLCITFSTVLIIAAAIHAVIIAVIGCKIAATILLITLSIELCNIAFLRMTGRFFLSGIFLTTILLITICSVCCFWGGWHSPGLMWLIFVSVIGTTLSGRKAGYIWLFITLLCVLIFCTLDICGFKFPNELNDHYLRQVYLLMLFGTIIVTWIFILVYEIFKDYMVHMHKIAKEEIRERAQMFNTILSASPFGIGLLKNRVVEWGNEEMARIFKLKSGEGIGWDARLFYPDDIEYNRVGKILYRDGKETGIKTVDAKMMRKTGEVFDSCIILNPIDPLDLSRGYILAIMDITERKQAEAEIKRLNKKLEERVFDRTLKLKNAQEEIINKEHKSELADMTTGTLHNVKNILNSVKVSTEMLTRLNSAGSIKGLKRATQLLAENKNSMEDFLLNNPKGEKLIEYYLTIGSIYNDNETESLKHLKRLQEKVAAIENIVTAQQEYAGRCEMEDVSLENLIEDALIMHADSFEAHQINITKEFSNIPQITAIKTKLMHILINLIKNAKEAMKSTPPSKRKLTFKTEKTNQSLLVLIKDTGCGVEPEHQKNLFQHGYTTKKDGHGFGLYSCYKYMKEMGGDISMESDGTGKGATFYLKFPAKM